MMFRNVQLDEDSESDWDEATAATHTPRGDASTTQSPASRYAPNSTTVESPQPQSQPTINTGYMTEGQPQPSHEPHPPHIPHPPLQPLHNPHPPLQPLHTPRISRPIHNTTVQNDIHGSLTPKRQHPPRLTGTLHTAPQGTPHYTHEAPQILPLGADQATQRTSLSPPLDLSPAVMNPVYGGELLTPADNALDHDDTISLVLRKESSEILEFASVNEDSAKQLLPSYQRPPPYSTMGDIAERADKLSKRWAQETVSCMKIVSDVIINFTLGLLHYFCYHIARKLCCGVVRIVSDSVVKSTVDVSFNDLFWPFCSCVYQLSKATVLILTPFVELVGTLLNYVASMLKACRLVELHFNNKSTQPIDV